MWWVAQKGRFACHREGFRESLEAGWGRKAPPAHCSMLLRGGEGRQGEGSKGKEVGEGEGKACKQRQKPKSAKMQKCQNQMSNPNLLLNSRQKCSHAKTLQKWLANEWHDE